MTPDTAWPRGMPVGRAAAYVGLSPSLLRREARAGRFPASVPLTAGRRVWLREHLDGWLDWKAGRRASWDADPGALTAGNEWLT